MSKFLYPIYKLKTKSYIKWWLYHKKAGGSGILSEILQGFSFNLENTLNRKFKLFEIQGNSEQETTEGNQLLDLSNFVSTTTKGITFTKNDDDSISFNGTSTDAITLDTPINLELTQNIDYTLSKMSTYAAGQYAISLRKENTSVIGSEGLDSSSSSRTYKLEENVTAKYFRIYIPKRVTINHTIYPMVNEGSTATNYEPYTGGIASPNPNYEQPIYSAGDNGSINEKIQTRNLWSSVWEQGYINANGVNENNSDLIRTKDYIYFEPEQKYAIKRSIATAYTNVRGYDKNKRFIGTGSNVIVSYSGGADNPMQATIQTCVIATKPGVYYLRFNDASNNLSTEYMMVKGDTPEDYVPHEEQDYSIFVQQPMRSIGDVRDCFVKVNGVWNEKHIPYIESYNGEALPQDVYNEVDGIKYCNEKSMSTTGQFSIGASVQYIDENNWNYLPCTEEQIEALENMPSTYKNFTIIQSQDETPAYLKIQYYKEG